MGICIIDKSECCGCRACKEICPVDCISMSEDEEGFVYPIADNSKCIGCHLCERVCPVNYDFGTGREKQQAWGGVHESDEVRFNSSSGGAFTALYEKAIHDGYVVYGVRWTENFKVMHDRADVTDKCRIFRKSKYVMSDTNGCYSKVEEDLKHNRKVLFSGTPCQCAALKMYLNIKRISLDGLRIIDIVCHGAPSQMVFDKYIEELKAGRLLYEFSFKNKIECCGRVNSRTAHIVFKDGESQIIDVRNDAFMQGYYGRLFYRPSCGTCKFARLERVSDITIADAWHIEDIYPDMDSLSGVSLIISNTAKGRDWVLDVHDRMKLKDIDVEWAHKANAQLNAPTQMHKGRKKFFQNLEKDGFSKAVKKAMEVPVYRKAASMVKRIVLNCLSRGSKTERLVHKKR